MDFSSRCGVRPPILALVLALAAWPISGPSAFAHGGGGGGGHGGGGHGGGGHGGGGHSGGTHSGGYHQGGYNRGGYGYYNGFWPGGYLGWGGYGYGGYGYGYGGYGYGYGNGYGYGYPYSNYGYTSPSYTYVDPAYGNAYAAQGAAAPAPSQGRYLGIDEQAVRDGGSQGMQVVQVYAGSPAEQAGLQVGDVIHAANGYTIQQHGNLTWVIANAAPDGVLQMTVHSASDGANRLITARIP